MKHLIFATLFMATPVFAVETSIPTASELNQSRIWAASRWEAGNAPQKPFSGLTVIANHDSPSKRYRGDAPMNLAGTKFDRGLYVHAPSNIRVSLPKAVKRLTATVGIDSNNQTSGGRGSVQFVVQSGDKKLFASEVLREGMSPLEIDVKLDGIQEFSLIVEETKDGISCDQSDWANAQVEFEDGEKMMIDELPFLFGPTSTDPPFSFKYDGKNSNDFLKSWTLSREKEKIDEKRTKHTLVWTDPETGLQVKSIGVEYVDFPVVEWTLYFKNTGTKNTPIISDIRAVDIEMPFNGASDSILHHHIGSPCTSNDYQPLQTALRPGLSKRLSGTNGRPSDQDWPYFNLANPPQVGGGTIAAVGWPGQWEAEFLNPDQAERRGRITFQAGQQQVNCTLLPDEEIRSPLIALLFWEGDRLRSQNVWRRWFLAHNAPKIKGELPKYHWTINTSPYYWEMVNTDTEKQIMFIDESLKHGLFIDYWWMDAGWYVNNGSWADTGTWEVDQKRFPKGLREISDHAKNKGVKTLVWFEPERVTEGTWLAEQHPDWVLGGKSGGLLNLGNPDVQKWLIEHIDGILTKEGIGLYRQDFNIAPLGFWRKNDVPDRQGSTENKHVCGYLAYWDELRRRHPEMSIDSCASGGRRNDLETLRRAIILHRSDNYETTGNQGQSFGLASWTPLFGIGTAGADPYHFRSMMTPFQNSSFDVRDKNFDFAIARKYQADWKRINKYFLADYYPLTSYSSSEEHWLAWQYNAYDGQSGIVQVFKRPQSPYTTCRLKMHGLDAGKTYVFEDLDGRPDVECSGRELMEKGLPLNIEESRVALILEYHSR